MDCSAVSAKQKTNMVSDTGRFQDSGMLDSATLEHDIYCIVVERMPHGAAFCRTLYHEGKPSDFVCLYTNPAFEQLTGLNQVVGRRISEVLPKIQHNNPHIFEVFCRVAAGGEAEQFEILVDSLQVRLSVSVFSPKSEHFVATFELISRSKQSEMELLAANQTWSLVNLITL